MGIPHFLDGKVQNDGLITFLTEWSSSVRFLPVSWGFRAVPNCPFCAFLLVFITIMLVSAQVSCRFHGFLTFCLVSHFLDKTVTFLKKSSRTDGNTLRESLGSCFSRRAEVSLLRIGHFLAGMRSD